MLNKQRRLQESDSTIYTFDQKSATNSATGFKFTQRFSIKFGPFISQPETLSTGTITFKSGNPGYMSNYPVLVSSTDIID